MAALSGLIRKFLGVQRAPIRFDRTGANWSVKASDFVDMAAEGAEGPDPDATEPMHLDHTGHPAADRFALARAARLHLHALGLTWEDVSGRNETDGPRRSPGATRSASSPRAPAATASSSRLPSSESVDARPASAAAPADHRRTCAAGPTRATAVVLLVLLPVVCWTWIAVMARDMYRTDDRRQRLDDDGELGWTAPVAALGDVDRHDDGHDAAVRLTPGPGVQRQRGDQSAQGTTGRQIYALDGGLSFIVWTRVQPRGQPRFSAGWAACSHRRWRHQFTGWRDFAARGGPVSADADGIALYTDVPVPAGIPGEPMARRMVGCAQDGPRTWRLYEFRAPTGR